VRARGNVLLAAAAAVVVMGTVHQPTGWPPDPATKPSEVTGRIFYCTAGGATGSWVDEKPSESAVKMEIVTSAESRAGDGQRYASDTVLGQATAPAGEVWRSGSVHQLSITWLQPEVTRLDLTGQSLRVRITRRGTGTRLLGAANQWAFSFFISLDAVGADDAGKPEIDWHLAVISTGFSVADQDTQTVVDTPFADLRGWPHPCPPR